MKRVANIKKLSGRYFENKHSIGDFDSCNFSFKAAEVGVLVFADAISEIDQRSLRESEFGCAGGKVPTYGAQCAAGAGKGPRLDGILRQL